MDPNINEVPNRSQDRSVAETPSTCILSDKLAIITIPKAGTYLLSEIARNFGWSQTYWHVREDSMEDYSTGTMEERRLDPDKFHQQRGVVEAAAFLPERSFFVGHIAYTPASKAALGGFRKILAVRELRNVLVSWLRFERRLQRSAHLRPLWAIPDDRTQMNAFLSYMGAAAFNQFRSLLPWLQEPQVAVAHFEDLRQPAAETVSRLGKVLQLDRAADLNLFQEALAADTLTKSPEAANFTNFWSDEAEEIFAALGGQEMNRLLGYAPSYTGTAK